MGPAYVEERTTASLAGRYLTFRLANEIYGIEILRVQEIIGLMAITKIPRAPECIRGVINLRGKVIPVIDLSLRFGLPVKEDTSRTCIIVIQFRSEHGMVIVGMVVDDVAEVVNVTVEQLEPPPDFSQDDEEALLLGIGKLGGNVVMLLDVDRVLSSHEINAVSNTTAQV